MRCIRATPAAALAGTDAAAVVGLRPDGSLLESVAHPHQWLAAAGTDAATAQLAGALLWLIAVWLGVGLLASAIGAVPGFAGRAARRFARLMLPGAIYRLAAGAVGLGIALTPVSATAATIHPRPGDTTPPWPTADRHAPHAPGWPTPRGAVGSGAKAAASHRPKHTHRPTGPEPSTHPQPAQVVVHRGDSLWQIAAAHLPGHANAHRIAAAWPRWFAANRRAIGNDPDLIQPGTVLRPPTEGSRS